MQIVSIRDNWHECQSLFSGKNQKHISNCCLLKFLPTVLIKGSQFSYLNLLRLFSLWPFFLQSLYQPSTIKTSMQIMGFLVHTVPHAIAGPWVMDFFYFLLTLVLLNTSCPVLANSVDPDQLASDRSQLIWLYTVIKYVNFYQKPGSSNLIGWNLEMGVASYLFSMRRVKREMNEILPSG